MKVRTVDTQPCAGSFIDIRVSDCPEGADVSFDWVGVDGDSNPASVTPTNDPEIYSITPLPEGSYSLKVTCCVSDS